MSNESTMDRYLEKSKKYNSSSDHNEKSEYIDVGNEALNGNADVAYMIKETPKSLATEEVKPCALGVVLLIAMCIIVLCAIVAGITSMLD